MTLEISKEKKLKNSQKCGESNTFLSNQWVKEIKRGTSKKIWKQIKIENVSKLMECSKSNSKKEVHSIKHSKTKQNSRHLALQFKPLE